MQVRWRQLAPPGSIRKIRLHATAPPCPEAGAGKTGVRTHCTGEIRSPAQQWCAWSRRNDRSPYPRHLPWKKLRRMPDAMALRWANRSKISNYLIKSARFRKANGKKHTLQRELTRSLTTIENARKEWLIAISRFPILQPRGGGPEGASGRDPEECRRIDPSVDQSFDLADDPDGSRTDMAFGSDPSLTSMVLIALWIRMGQ